MVAMFGCMSRAHNCCSGWLWLVVDAAVFFITAAMNWFIKYYGSVLLSLSTVSITVVTVLVGRGWLLMLLFFSLLLL